MFDKQTQTNIKIQTNTQTNSKKGKQNKQIYQCLFELKDACLRNIRFV
jgi:hypothetical protein